MSLQVKISKDGNNVFWHGELRHLLKLVCYSLESLIRVVGPVLGVPTISITAIKARTDYYDQREKEANN